MNEVDLLNEKIEKEYLTYQTELEPFLPRTASRAGTPFAPAQLFEMADLRFPLKACFERNSDEQQSAKNAAALAVGEMERSLRGAADGVQQSERRSAKVL